MDMATERVIGMRIKYLVLNMTAVMLLISGCAQPEINSITAVIFNTKYLIRIPITLSVAISIGYQCIKSCA